MLEDNTIEKTLRRLVKGHFSINLKDNPIVITKEEALEYIKAKTSITPRGIRKPALFPDKDNENNFTLITSSGPIYFRVVLSQN